jgi:hypothetical protein
VSARGGRERGGEVAARRSGMGRRGRGKGAAQATSLIVARRKKPVISACIWAREEVVSLLRNHFYSFHLFPHLLATMSLNLLMWHLIY